MYSRENVKIRRKKKVIFSCWLRNNIKKDEIIKYFCGTDELGLEEPRGTAAALGDGDVFLHSQHEHGTGGHWCAKIIFFSLLAVLVTLIGLIILENRGLSECKYI